MNEKIYTFGRNNQLIGILTKGDVNLRNDKLPVILLWNAGLLHRIGPYRMWVDIGRIFSSQGFNVFRFDICGKGDSERHEDDRPHEERASHEIRATMNFLSSTINVNEFILIGFCSGADEALPVAVLDSRVSGIVLLDGFGYRTFGYYLRRYGLNVFRIDAWKKLLRKPIIHFLKKNNDKLNLEEKDLEIFEREFPPQKRVAQYLKNLVNRDANIFFVYSGFGSYLYYNYYSQFSQMFKCVDLKGKVKIAYFKEADHLYTRLADRNRLTQSICEWIQFNYLDL